MRVCLCVSECVCVCDTVMMRGWGIPGFLHEAADRCGRLESKLFCWPTSKGDFSSVGLFLLSIPLSFAHALASSSRFSPVFQAEAWN